MDTNNGLQKHLSPLAVWAFAIGSAIGWGSLVVTSKTYLSQAGPMGSILGLLVGFGMMLMVARHYHVLENRHPDAGGLYGYVKNVFGYDRAFLVAWFMFLIYVAIFWANATSIPLFARYFLHNVFSFGRLFTIFGYEVYLGEALVTLAVIGLVGLLCAKSNRISARMMVVLVLIFTAGITVCFTAAMMGRPSTGMTMDPAFVPDKNALRQVVRIAFISPWAFIGFESVSNAASEFKFKHSKLFRILVISLIVTTALYIFIILMSTSAYPEGCSSWFDYISRLNEFEGIAGLPAFYAADYYMGSAGVYILMASLFALVLTSLIGMLRAVSRLCFFVARDGILPDRFAKLSKNRIPVNAILLVLVLSIPIPFLGRTAIGWIVDTTTIGATILYGFASAAVFKVSKKDGRKSDLIFSGTCLIILVAFSVFLLFPSLFSDHTIETETYVLMSVWSFIGLLFFNVVIRKDHARNFGKAIIVWIALLGFITLVTLAWVGRASELRENEVMESIHQYFHYITGSDTCIDEHLIFLDEQRQRLQASDNLSIITITALFVLSLGAMLANYISQRKWEKKATDERDQARTAALTDPLTGVKSKHAFLISEKQYDDAIGEHSAKEFAIAVCDVNGLKVINDTQGHKAGDEYIKNAGIMICDIFQHSPVYRIGGDEFVVILTGRDYTIRKELVLALHDRSVVNIGSGGVVISGGYSDYDPEKDSTFHDVFERADALMYKEKQLLKSMGSISREDAETSDAPSIKIGEDSEILKWKRYILIVEDEEINQIMLGNALQEYYDILYAADGIEALEQIKTHKEELALVLLDLQMPRMNGMEVLKVMREEDEFKDIPVLVMTADQSAEIECLKIGATDFIPKPYPGWDVVIARVNRCIELSEKRSIIKTTERDSLTKLFNTEYFLRYVRMYDQRYIDCAMDAIVLNVNRFHVLNERYGKQYGDSVLFHIGTQVRAVARKIGGVAARRGADTFLIYCPHRDDYDSILDQASESITGDDKSASNRVRLRMGVYAYVDKTLEIERRFDYAMIAANSVKNGYKKSIGIYDDQMREAELYRERLLEDFRNSLDNGHFAVFFQPKFDIRPEKPVLASAEALVRWKHPELGMISPAVFIPLLEDNGLILELDKFVWSKTAETIRGWKDRFGYSIPVSVNVSRIDMLTPDLKSILKQTLDRYDLDTNDLILEITESAYTGDAEQIISTAKDLRGMGMGFRIEMDDFGTGYSSLGMLTTLPIDALKLDMSFVRSAFGEVRDVRMIELIIDIADYIHVPVVAEGVETEEQYKVLKAMGCDVVQGYYFSKPVPAGEFEHFLIERSKEKAEIPPKAKKTYINLSKALTGNFENIYYVDLVTNFYLEFRSGKKGDLEILPGGQDFFGDLQEKFLSDVCAEDQDPVRNALGKNNLIQWIEKEETVSLPFGKMKDGKRKQYILQTIRTRTSDDHHVVIGVKPE